MLQRDSAKRRTGKGYLGVVILNGVSLAKGGLFHRHYGLEHERHPRRRLHTPPNRWAPRRHVSDAVCNHCFACMFRIIALFFFLFGRRAFCGVCNMYLFFPPRPLRPPPPSRPHPPRPLSSGRHGCIFRRYCYIPKCDLILTRRWLPCRTCMHPIPTDATLLLKRETVKP